MLSILYNIIISPIELVVEVVFELMWRLVGRHETDLGLAVIGVSVAVSLLTLPLYRRADVVQQKERDTQKRLSHWVSHIKRTFKGDERFMMLQAYYRENGYSPLYALRGTLSLLLEIPFFIAAYHFLSHLGALRGASFGFISDLGKPDGLGWGGVNILPILMTAINCVSASIYLKGFPAKDKVQTYGMVLIFLVLLYNSPAGLVVYWTCNNIFSLVKNVFYKLKNPRKVAYVMCAALGTFLTLALFMSGKLNSRKKYIAVLLFQYAALLPLFFYLYKNSHGKNRDFRVFANIGSKDSGGIFIFSCAILALLAGFVVPSNIIVSSPAEFVVNNTSPVYFIFISLAQAIGFFFAWPLCIRMLSKGRKIASVLDIIFCCLAFSALLNAFVFPLKAGLVSMFLEYENAHLLSLSAIGKKRLFLNIIGIVAASLFVMLMSRSKCASILKKFGIVATVGLVLLGVHNIVSIQKTFGTHQATLAKSNAMMGGNSGINPIFHFSKTGKNVFIIMLDRGAGAYVPYIFNERESLYDDYEGFTYYPNTVSFSLYTLAGSPPVYGGYEYVPVLQNKETRKSLLEKREEAVSLLPRIFAMEGWSVLMTNMPWIGESDTSDFYFMDNYPEKITSLFTAGRYRKPWILKRNKRAGFSAASVVVLNRNFFCNGIVNISPYFMRELLYDAGRYIHEDYAKIEFANFKGDAWSLLNAYSELDCLPDVCDTNAEANSFVFMYNPMPHHPAYLQAPDYTIENDVVLDESNPLSKDASYHVNAASLILLGKWLRWLKENDVYDNTRIIICADHGTNAVKSDSKLPECQVFPRGEVNPLFLVKDFNARGKLETDERFMTNADVPSIAVKNIIVNPINPATGADITNISLKNPAVITLTDWQETNKKYGNVDTPQVFALDDDSWWAVSGSIFDKDAWQKISPKVASEKTEKQLR